MDSLRTIRHLVLWAAIVPWLADFVLAAPYSRFKFEEDVVREVMEKLENINMTRAMLDLDALVKTDDHKNILLRPRVAKRSVASPGSLGPLGAVPGDTYMGKDLSSLLEVLQLGQVAYEVENSLFGGASCTACKAGLLFLKYYLESGANFDDAIENVLMMCQTFGFVSEEVCRGLVLSFGKQVYTVIKSIDQSAEEMCEFMFGQACTHHSLSSAHDWDIMLPPVPKPKVGSNSRRGWNKSKFKYTNAWQQRGEVIRVLHLSDTHFDPYYLEGSNADCGEFLCCRETSGQKGKDSEGAGYWGDYRKCDTPLRTIEAMYEQIAANHTDIGLIYWTGDLPPHDIWNQTKEGNLEVLRSTVQQLKTFFPDTMILPALGNHESVPVDLFPIPSIKGIDSIQWLYDALDVEWRGWIGDGHRTTVQYGAYYSLNVAPGLRVISLNMNYCMNKNIWLLLNSTDPAEELRWLTYELQLAEFKGEKVHILGHVPPGHVDCVQVWSKAFNKIIERYEDTVAAQFYGHTHLDEFEIFFSREDGLARPINVAYIGPSVTTYYGLNPSYRIYDVDTVTGKVLDHETWYMNLTDANLHGPAGKPKWHLLYRARQDYKMDSLEPSEWFKLLQRLQKDEVAFKQFYRYYHSNSDLRPMCDIICRKQILCNLKSSKSHSMQETCSDETAFWRGFDIMSWIS